MLDGTPGGTVDKQRHDGFLKGFGIKKATRRSSASNHTRRLIRVRRARTSCPPRINVVYTINEPAGTPRGNQKGRQAQGIV
jgi:fructose transport system substrate-binding protein